MTEERKPAFWVVKNDEGRYFTGNGACMYSPVRASAKAWSTDHLRPWFSIHHPGAKLVPVYVTTRKVKRPRKLTELQRNAVADYVAKQYGHIGGTTELCAGIRSGKAGL